MRKLIITLVVLISIAAAAQAPMAHGSGTLTRSASKYKDLETALFQALEDNDRPAAEKILADDFEACAAEKPGSTSRAQWLQVFLGNLKSFQIRDIAVHEFQDVDVVSFMLERSGTQNGKPMTPVLFVVDVWQKNGNKLRVRYASAPANPAPKEAMHKD